MKTDHEKLADCEISAIKVRITVEEIARMNSTELFNFVRQLTHKWPTLADQICQNLTST